MSPESKEPLSHNKPANGKPIIDFDFNASLADIEKRLEAERQRAANEFIQPQHTKPHEEIITQPIPAPTEPAASATSGGFESSFLAELAKEAAQKQGTTLSKTQELQARTQRLHDALTRVTGFFNPLIKFANNMEPEITRIYRLDARTAFTNLKWRDAFLDSRKQDLSATALLAHVTFSVNYCAPEPVLVTRPWNQLEALKAELNNLRLKVIDESELDGKRPKQEWLQVHLSPNLPLQLRFQANYDKGHIDVLSRNLLAFGISSFRLQPEHITSELLDDVGRVLLSRADELPAAFTPL